MIAVIDASVALKWQFEDEEVTDKATALLEDFIEGKIDLIAPTLFPYEIVNAVNVAINRKRIGETIGYQAITYLSSVGIETRGFSDLIERTFYLARQFNISPYDCAYLALAEKEKCDFFTGDKKLFKGIKDQFHWITWIGEYQRIE
jgi:predicted nucleic acid-binding protein